MPSGLAVGIWVRPVRIRTSLFFRELWSIGWEKKKNNNRYLRLYKAFSSGLVLIFYSKEAGQTLTTLQYLLNYSKVKEKDQFIPCSLYVIFWKEQEFVFPVFYYNNWQKLIDENRNTIRGFDKVSVRELIRIWLVHVKAFYIHNVKWNTNIKLLITARFSRASV